MDTENYLNFSKFDFSKEHNMVFVKQAIRGTQEAAMDRYFIGSLEKNQLHISCDNKDRTGQQ